MSFCLMEISAAENLPHLCMMKPVFFFKGTKEECLKELKKQYAMRFIEGQIWGENRPASLPEGEECFLYNLTKYSDYQVSVVNYEDTLKELLKEYNSLTSADVQYMHVRF